MSDDYETKKAAVLAQRAEARDLIKAWSEFVGRTEDFLNARYPMPKREPKVVECDMWLFRVVDGAAEIAQQNGFGWQKCTLPDLATMRALVADADAQERGE